MSLRESAVEKAESEPISTGKDGRSRMKEASLLAAAHKLL